MSLNKVTNNKINFFWIVLLTIAFLIPNITPVFAQAGKISEEQKMEILYTPAFYICGVENPQDTDTANIQKTTSNREAELLAMSDENFKQAIKERIQWAIDQKKAGVDLYWHPEALRLINIIAPELESVVNDQLINQATQEKVKSTKTLLTANFTPGNTSKVFYIINSSAGTNLWKFNMRVNWAWNSTRITSISHSCFANVYAAAWTYNGVNDQEGHYVVNYYAYDQYCEGSFSSTLQNSYPYLDALVQADGVYTCSGGYN